MKERDFLSNSSQKLTYSAHVESYFVRSLEQYVGQQVAIQTSSKGTYTGYLQQVHYDSVELQIDRQVFYIRLMEIIWFSPVVGV